MYPRSNPSGFITGVDLSALYPRSNPSGFITNQNVVYTTGNQTISGIKTFIDKPTYGNSQVYIESGTSANISENQIVYVPQFDNINTLNFDATLVYISSSGLLRLPTGAHNLSFGQTQYLNILITGPAMAGGTFYIQNPLYGFVSGQFTQVGWQNIYETKSITYNYLNLYKTSTSSTWELNKNRFITDLEQQNEYFVNTTGDQTILGVKSFGDDKKIILNPTGLNEEFFLIANSGASIFNLIGTENSIDYELFEGQKNPLISGSPELNIFAHIILNSAPPLTTGDPGIPGSITWDTGYFYICVDNNSWKRVGLNVW